MIDITPADTTVPLIEFNIVGVGQFQLPVLGQKGTPFGITNAFGLFMHSRNGADEQKIAAWASLISTLSDTFPNAVRIMSRLDEPDISQIFAAWGKESKEYDPKA